MSPPSLRRLFNNVAFLVAPTDPHELEGYCRLRDRRGGRVPAHLKGCSAAQDGETFYSWATGSIWLGEVWLINKRPVTSASQPGRGLSTESISQLAKTGG